VTELYERLSRQTALIGKDKTDKIISGSVLVFGCGGVGGYAVEALARAGIGRITIVDGDVVSESNINRQIIANTSVIGINKANLAADRVKKINPDALVTAIEIFADSSNIEKIITDAAPGYIIDAIDDVNAKVEIIRFALSHSIPIVSCMGTGNKLDPMKFKIADISKTSVCPLARSIRRRLRDIGITSGLPVLFSEEEPVNTKSSSPASISFVPPVAGLLLAGWVIKKYAEI